MAEFTADWQIIAPSLLFLDNIAPNMELADQFNPSVLDYSSLNFQTYLPSSNDNIFSNQGPEFQGNLVQNFPNFVEHDDKSNRKDEAPAAQPLVAAGNEFKESKKRITMDDVSESSSGISTPTVSETGTKRKNSSGRGKRVKRNVKEDEKPQEVVHVRARRGQATDSHSLAERVRRGKINERLRCLQDIVPGCTKTMGMSGMLDEIINYVQCLQNQVEFLSMKLTAASSFYDFNSSESETDAMEAMQRAKELEILKKEEGYGGFGSFHSTWAL